ncbi:MAG: AMP-binding protein [Cytophagales bacterium]|nr:AMP-binding protein [Cytophagales bacterium]
MFDFSHSERCSGWWYGCSGCGSQEMEEVTGRPLVEGYGLSETSPVLCCNPLDGNHNGVAIGIPMPSTKRWPFLTMMEIQLTGEAGEICARGPQVMRGYWEKDNTGVFFPGDWFRTGDIGLMNEDGYFKIVDRKERYDQSIRI